MYNAPPHHSNSRFYIVLITVIVAGIFVLLILNDNYKSLNLTGSSVGLFKDTEESVDVVDSDTETVVKGKVSTKQPLLIDSEEDSERDIEKIKDLRSREVSVVVDFDQVPFVNKDVTVKDLEVRFNNPNTKFILNSDLLELNNLDEVVLTLEDFAGKVNFDDIDFSLDGKAKKIKVNGMSFSSKDKLDLSLSDVEYSYLSVDDIALKDISFANGNGHLNVGEKLNYVLEQEELNFYTFNGKITIDHSADSLLMMEGVARGIDVSGAFLNLDVR